MILIYILLAVFLVSIISLLGIFFLAFKTKTLNKITTYLVSFAAGSLFGAAFLHIMPEAIEELPGMLPFGLLLIGILLFFIIEKGFHWRHCHEQNCKSHIGYLNLFGDAIHNFIDGIAIASAFLININTGIITTLSILLHEIPQELGDFGILIHSGFTRAKALLYNFYSAIFAILGALIAYLLSNYVYNFTIYLMPIVAGGFIYLAGSDLIPEIHKEKGLKVSILQTLFLAFGLILIFLMSELLHLH